MSETRLVTCCLLVVCCLRLTATSVVCSGSADTIQMCSHCTFTDSACTDAGSETVGVTDVAVCRTNCYTTSTSCDAFLYDADQQKCWNLLSTCAGYKYTSGNLYVYRKTCNSDCPTFTLSANVKAKLSFSLSLYSDMDTTMTEAECFARCFDTPSCYVFSYGPFNGDMYCTNHFSCDGSCQADFGFVDGFSVYAKTCKVDRTVWFSRDGMANRTCINVSGEWYNDEATCNVVDCGSLPSITDGAVNTPSGVTYGATATYTCDSGYTMAGSATRSCQADGAWSGSEPTCSIVNCGSLSSITDGAVNTPSGVTYGATATYTCDSGYTMAGSATRSCQADGAWSGSEPTCSIVNCGGLSSITDGVVNTPSGVTYGATATYTCDSGYTMAGSATRSCQADGAWSGSEPTCSIVNCGGLSSITDGAINTPSGVTYGATATYTCDSGYTMAGSATRSCQADGAWSGSEPTCSIVNCGSLSSITDGAVNTPSGVTYGATATATYTCDSGYTMAGSATRSCQADEAWSGSEPTCSIVNCGSLSSITDGAVNTPSGVTYGATATYTCDSGYTMAGSATRSCQADGAWSGSEPTCSIVNCGSLSSITDGAVNTPSGVTYGATATYTCDSGYTMAGSATRSCQADGAWSGSEPTCIIVNCGSLSSITDGALNTPSGVTYGATATYTCDSGYTMAGSATRSCQADGAWSGSETTCSIVTTTAVAPPPTTLGATLPVSTTTAPVAALYIRPCLCGNNSFAGMTQEEIIEQLVSAIKIDTKNTSLARNKRISMHDGRASSTMIGVVGTTFMVVIFGGMFVFDVIAFFKSKDVCYVHRRVKRN